MVDKDDQNQNQGNRPNSQSFQNPDNDYGLPEAEFSPIEREQHQEVPIEPVAYDQSFRERETKTPEKSSSWPMWAALVAILVLAGVFVYFFLFDTTESEMVATKPAEETNTFIVEEQPPVAEAEETEWEVPAEPEVVEGTVSTISSRTGRYYVIVGSFIDSDLANDFAGKLAKEGMSAKIIEPSGTRKFYRLSVKDAEGLDVLKADLDSMRQKFGENVWIVKY